MSECCGVLAHLAFLVLRIALTALLVLCRLLLSPVFLHANACLVIKARSKVFSSLTADSSREIEHHSFAYLLCLFHGLGAYSIQQVEEQDRFLAEPCLLHPALSSDETAGLFIRQTTLARSIGPYARL